jgi:ATP-dependent DNA helicase HFM1/MER3
MWDNSIMECRQLPGIGKLLSERLAAAGLGKLRELETADARKIESVTQRNYPFGAYCILNS